jgi:hypothetical protein
MVDFDRFGNVPYWYIVPFGPLAILGLVWLFNRAKRSIK